MLIIGCDFRTTDSRNETNGGSVTLLGRSTKPSWNKRAHHMTLCRAADRSFWLDDGWGARLGEWCSLPVSHIPR
jgi:hypothetical protein